MSEWISAGDELPAWKSIDEPVYAVVNGRYDVFVAYCCKNANEPFTEFTVENSIWLNPNNDEPIREVEEWDYWLPLPAMPYSIR